MQQVDLECGNEMPAGPDWIEVKKEITDEMSQRLASIFESIAHSYGITLLEWNCEEDHVCVLLKAEPSSPLSKYMNAHKSASSRLIKKEFPQIREKLWEEYFWSKSYCLISADGAPLGILR